MSDWIRTRRAVLAAGAGTLGLLAGCIGDGTDTGGTETSTDTPQPTTETPTDTPQPTPRETTGDPAVATLSFNHARKLHRRPEGFYQRDVSHFYLAVLTSDRSAEAFPTERFENEAARAFIEETDFSGSALVVLQDRKSSSHPDLKLLDTGRDGNWLTVEAEYPGEGATADITTDTLLVRVPTGGEPVHGGRVTVHPQYGDPVRISTANVYDTVPEFGTSGELAVQNRECESVTPSVTVTHRGDLFFRRRFELEPATRHTVAGLFTHPGEWMVTVEANGKTTTRTWNLTDAPSDVRVDIAGDGTVSLSRLSEIGDDPMDVCQPDGFTYESSDPAANVDPPVDLWVLDRGERSSRLTVTVTDEDTRVFTRSYETSTGIDKIHRPDLLAKRADYTVTVTAADGRELTETVTVGEGSTRLTVQVTEADNLEVSLS